MLWIKKLGITYLKSTSNQTCRDRNLKTSCTECADWSFLLRILLTRRNTSKLGPKLLCNYCWDGKSDSQRSQSLVCVNHSPSNRRAVYQQFQLPQLFKKEGTSIAFSQRVRTTVIVSDHQMFRLEPELIHTGNTDQESTDKDSESSKGTNAVSSDAKDDASVIEWAQPSGSTRTWSRNWKQPVRFGQPNRAKLLYKGGRMRRFWSSNNLRGFFLSNFMKQKRHLTDEVWCCVDK